MIEDTLLQYLLRKLDTWIEQKRDALEGVDPENLRQLQGELQACRDMRQVMTEQYQNWLRGEDSAPGMSVSEFDRMLEGAATVDEDDELDR